MGLAEKLINILRRSQEMKTYYLHLIEENKQHQIHVISCRHIIDFRNFEHLGDFDNCENAIFRAQIKHLFWKINGCKDCCKTCHKEENQ